MSLTRGNNSAIALTPASTVCEMPPHSWIVSKIERLLLAGPLSWISPSPFDQVDRLPGLAAEADEDVGRDIGVLGEAGEGAIELPVVGAVVLHGAAGLVRDRRRRRPHSGTASSRSVVLNRCVMYLLVWAEQLTVLMTAM